MYGRYGPAGRRSEAAGAAGVAMGGANPHPWPSARPSRRRALLAAGAATVTSAACAGAGGGGGQAAPGQAPPATLEIWSPAMDASQAAAQEQVHQEFQHAHPHLTLNLLQIPGGWDPLVEKLQLSITGDVQPQATRLPDNPIRQLIARDQLTALDSLIKQDRFDLKPLDQAMLERTTKDGKRYTLPWSGGMLALAYNRDLFEQAGVAVPETTRAMSWDHFLNAAVAIRRLGDDVWGFRVGGNLETPNWDTVKEWLPWLWSNGNDYFDKTETKPLFGEPNGVAAGQLLTDLMLKLKVAPGPGQPRPDGTSGKVGMWVQQSDVIVRMKNLAPTVRFGCSLIPIGPSGKTSYGVQGGSYIAIPQGARHQTETWRYLRWITDEKINLRLVSPVFQDPVHPASRLKPPYSDNPPYAAFVEQFKTARVRPGSPAYRPTEESTAEQLQAAYRGEKSVPEAIKTAVEKAVAIIQQNLR
ncbi:MAG TPA: sugar ABC transporter substrate-binding protein [Chloroflexota bacterium]|nr:sugar ABC transporter substrate-binding protein [Chloroflexota bacterium]